MIRNYHSKSAHATLAFLVVLTLGALMALLSSLADPTPPNTADTAKKEATAAMLTWMGEIDSGQYAKSWDDASKTFQKALTSDKWVAAAGSVRTPLGKLLERKQASALYQTSVPMPTGEMIKGQFVIAQFTSSFENLKSAMETVVFEKEADGVWRASGYFIKPR